MGGLGYNVPRRDSAVHEGGSFSLKAEVDGLDDVVGKGSLPIQHGGSPLKLGQPSLSGSISVICSPVRRGGQAGMGFLYSKVVPR